MHDEVLSFVEKKINANLNSESHSKEDDDIGRQKHISDVMIQLMSLNNNDYKFDEETVGVLVDIIDTYARELIQRAARLAISRDAKISSADLLLCGDLLRKRF